jgi:hypothetical protein
MDPTGAILVYIKRKPLRALHQKSTQDGHPCVMKTEQPISRQPVETSSKTSHAEERVHGSARSVPPQGLGHPKDASAFLSLVLGQQEESLDEAEGKWSGAATLRLALISCGLFWVIVAVGVWAYFYAH